MNLHHALRLLFFYLPAPLALRNDLLIGNRVGAVCQL